MTVLAIAFAMVAACFFAASVTLQHKAVRAERADSGLAVRALGRVVRSRGWLAGTLLALTGSALHLVALSLAPLAVVQPVGVLSLVLVVLFRGDLAAPRVRAAVFAVCLGVGGFVLLAAFSGAVNSVVDPAAVQPAVLAGPVVVLAGLCVRGRARCLGLGSAAAVLFGLGSAVLRAAALQVSGGSLGMAAGLAAEGLVLLLAGGWLLHQAYAAGPAAVVVGAATVLDPLTAVVVGLVLYGETPHLVPAVVVAQIGLALLAVSGVFVLAGSVTDPPERDKEHIMPNLSPRSGLRILLGADTFPPDVNGAAHFTDRLARGLAQRGHDVHVLCPEPDRVPRPDGVLTVHHVRSLRTPFHPTFRFTTPGRARHAAEALLDELQPDVVHVQSHFAAGRSVLAAAVERNVPAVATNHFMPENLLGYAPLPQFVRGPLTRWAWRDLVRVFRKAGTVTTPTPRAAELLAENGLPGLATAISCGIDIRHYERFAEEPGEGFAVLFVGRLDAEKNIDELIRAIAPLPEVRAEIVGEGSCRESLTALARKLGVADRVRFRGFVTDAELVRAYQRCQVFCMPGTAELQSLATMEAMAAGLPVVAADAMALPHLVYTGLNGFLYPPGDVTTLSARLSQLAHDEAKRAAMGEAGRHVIARHDISKTLDAFEDLYRKSTGTLEPLVEAKVALR